jgi:undecaprenyl diphosphate synthase
MSLTDQINRDKIPQHVAIIMDGNGRWAQQKGEMRIFGHASGVEAVRESLIAAAEIGVKYLTLYAFSTENWNRPKFEVDALMDLLVNTIASEIETLNENQVKLHAIGDLENLPQSCRNALDNAIEATSTNDRVNLVLALSYSARWELTEAMKKITTDIQQKNLSPDEINEDIISSYLATSNMPDPELLIRTSGEHRISNFLLWQLAYTELYFTDMMWPDFKKENFYQAIIDYQQRERRFGKVGEQLQQDESN